jgi:uncharacterized membrane protein
MINATTIFKSLHVLSAMIWVGGGVMLQMLLYRARQAGPESVARFNEGVEWTSKHVFMPASFSALVFGIATTAAGHYGFSKPWINIGFAGFLLSSLIGMAVLGPTSKKMKALIAERGPHDPVVAHMERRIQLFGRIDLIILVLVVLDMVIKPGV